MLYFCIHTALLLISPFMPFLSEELFQRLPTPAPSPPASVCVAAYPDPADFEVFLDEKSEEDFKFGMKIVSEVRSAKTKYDIPSKTSVDLYLQTGSDAVTGVLSGLSREVASLG